MNTDQILRRIWHAWELVPVGVTVIDGIGRPWTSTTRRGLPAFTDGTNTVHPSDLEFPVTERR